MTRLNIGAGKTYIPGYSNIDISEQAEITLDLGKDPLPFETGSVDLIFSYHTLEHVPNYLFALSEIHRVLKHGGVLLMGVPYVTSTKYNLVNPYHLHHFNEHSFEFFGAIKGSAIEENQIAFEKVYHKYYWRGMFNFMPYPFSRWCKNHLFNVVKKIDFGVVAIKDESPLSNQSPRELKALFNTIKKQRVPYEKKEKKKLSLPQKLVKATDAWWQGEL